MNGEDHVLYWNDDMVAYTYVMSDHVEIEFGRTWQEFLEQGNLRDLWRRSDESLQAACMRKAKGKGKGKGKGKSVPHDFWINPEDY